MGLGELPVGRNSAERARAFLGHMLDSLDEAVIVVRRHERIIVEANAGAARLAGVAREELLGRTTEWLYGSREAWDRIGAEVEAALAAATDSRSRRVLMRGDGSPFAAELYVRTLEGEAGFVVVVVRDVTAAEAQAQALAASEARYRRLVEQANEAIVSTDRAGLVRSGNAAAAALFGWSLGEVRGRSFLMFFEEGERDAVRNSFARLVLGESTHVQRTCLRKDGSTFEAEIAANGLIDGEVLAIVRDVTERQRAEEAALAGRHLLARTLAALEEAVIGWERPDGAIVEANPAAARLTGRPLEELLGAPIERLGLLSIEGAPLRPLASGAEAVVDGLLRRVDGVLVPVRGHARAIEGTRPLGVIALRDVSEEEARRQESEQHAAVLQHAAHHDALTGLPNRALLDDRLEGAMARVRRAGQKLALLYLDLDRFKNVNDTYGHHAGDELLVEVGKRLSAAVRATDTVARLGGDEFVVLLEDVAGAEAAAAIGRKIGDALAEPIVLDHHDVRTGTSIGIAMFPGDGEDAGALGRAADAALYLAKDRGRGNHQFFTEALNKRVQGAARLHLRLRQALARGELTLAWQPQVNLHTGTIEAFEALLRWTDAELGVVPALSIVRAAEESGLIAALGTWTIEQICRQADRWRASGHPIRVIANVSPVQLRFEDFPEVVGRALRSCSLPASLLELEIPEPPLVADLDHVVPVLAKLRGLGVRLALDDFGIGLSSLRELRRLPLDRLKLSHELFPDALAEPGDEAVLRAASAVARSLGLQVVAEGIETPEQLGFARSLGCDLVQGFLYAAPGSVERATELLVHGLGPIPAPPVRASP